MIKPAGPEAKRAAIRDAVSRSQEVCVFGDRPVLIIDVQAIDDEVKKKQTAEPSEDLRKKITLVAELQTKFRDLFPITVKPSRAGTGNPARKEDERPSLIAMNWDHVFDSFTVTCKDKVHPGLPCLYLFVHGKSDQHHYVKQPLVHACQSVYLGILDSCKPKHGTDRKWTSDSAAKRVLALNIKGETGKDKERTSDQQVRDLKDSLLIAGNHLCNKCPCTKPESEFLSRCKLVRFIGEDGRAYLRCECSRKHVNEALFEVKRKLDSTEPLASSQSQMTPSAEESAAMSSATSPLASPLVGSYSTPRQSSGGGPSKRHQTDKGEKPAIADINNLPSSYLQFVQTLQEASGKQSMPSSFTAAPFTLAGSGPHAEIGFGTQPIRVRNQRSSSGEKPKGSEGLKYLAEAAGQLYDVANVRTPSHNLLGQSQGSGSIELRERPVTTSAHTRESLYPLTPVLSTESSYDTDFVIERAREESNEMDVSTMLRSMQGSFSQFQPGMHRMPPLQTVDRTRPGIMISYHNESQYYALMIRNSLYTEDRYNVFMRTFEDAAWAEWAVMNSNIVVVLVTRQYNTSKLCEAELFWAKQYHKKILPILLEPGLTGEEWLRRYFDGLKIYDFATISSNLREIVDDELLK